MAKNRSKVMYIPIDYTKTGHVVMFCNGNGKVIRKPFSIKIHLKAWNIWLIKSWDPAAIIESIWSIFLFGGEDCGTYADNFINTLHSENWLVAGGLDYPGVGPEHTFLKDIKRAIYHGVTDKHALEAFKILCRQDKRKNPNPHNYFHLL